jgi:hypothetical protein
MSLVEPTPTIPKIIYMTTDIKLQHVPDLLKSTCEGFEVHIYDGENARASLERVWGQDIVHRFDALKKGAHKMDLWRYCMLYTYGGVYLDIKTIPIANVGDVFAQRNTWYTCLSAFKGCYQGIIATPPGNGIMLECIRQVMLTFDRKLALEYLTFTVQMHTICKRAYNSACDVAGEYPLQDRRLKAPTLVLFQETCNDAECRLTRRDRYNLCCNIRNDKSELLFRTRHHKYPWETLPEDETCIQNRKNVHIVRA